MKNLDFSTPAGSLFSEKALEVQRTLQSSLTLSLRKEAEMKPKLHTSGSEILCESKPKENGETVKSVSRVLNFSQNSVADNENVCSLSSPDKRVARDSALTMPMFHSELNGPNICLSTQFPSTLSPIRKLVPNNTESNEKSLLELSQLSKGFDEDPNTKKLMEFIQKLEKGAISDGTLAERMNQLSFMLKNSSLNCGSASDTEEVKNPIQLAATQHNNIQETNSKDLSKKPPSKFLERNQMVPTKHQKGKSVTSKKVERSNKPVSNQQIKPKAKTTSSMTQAPQPKSVHVSSIMK